MFTAVFQIITLHLRVHVQSSSIICWRGFSATCIFSFVKNQVTAVRWTYTSGLYFYLTDVCIWFYASTVWGFFFFCFGRRKGFIFSTIPHHISSQNTLEAGADAEAREECSLLASPITGSACFLIEPRFVIYGLSYVEYVLLIPSFSRAFKRDVGFC